MLKCSESAICGDVRPERPCHGFQKSTFAEDHPLGLTEREDQILRLMARGFSSKRIGRDLDISDRTVEIHRGNVIEKLGARNTTHAVAIGFVSEILSEKDLEEGD